MAKKKLVKPAGKKEQARSQSEKTIQYVAGAMVLIVIVFFAWQYFPKGAPKQYDSAPEMTIDLSKKYFATVEMETGGQFVIELFPDKAPITVNSFVFLANEGFYDGVTFHRVLEGFMAQGGDPTGTGGGGPGYEVVSEISDLIFAKAGVVAMANSGPDTNGSQFFITFGLADFLNGGYTIFGQVTDGIDVVNGITRRDPDTSPAFTGDVLESVTIDEK